MSPGKQAAAGPTSHATQVVRRVPWIDAYRGIGIAGVVLSHIVTEATVGADGEAVRVATHSLLYLFNVQVLAFVSGFANRTISIRTKAERLLVPLGSWLVLYAVVATLAAAASGSGVTLRSFVAQLLGTPNGVLGVLDGQTPLWFLWALFVAHAIVRALERWGWALGAVAVVFGLLWPLLPYWTLIRNAGMLLPCLVLGHVLGRCDDRRQDAVSRLWPLFLAGFGVAALAYWRIEGTPFWVGAEAPAPFMPIMALMMLASALFSLALYGFSRLLLRGWLLRAIAFLGVNTMGVFGFHWPLLLTFPALFRATSLAQIPVRWALLLTASLALTLLVARLGPARFALLGQRSSPTEAPRTA